MYPSCPFSPRHPRSETGHGHAGGSRAEPGGAGTSASSSPPALPLRMPWGLVAPAQQQVLRGRMPHLPRRRQDTETGVTAQGHGAITAALRFEPGFARFQSSCLSTDHTGSKTKPNSAAHWGTGKTWEDTVRVQPLSESTLSPAMNRGTEKLPGGKQEPRDRPLLLLSWRDKDRL